MDFGTDTNPLPVQALPGSNVGLGWFNNNRKRLRKFALQYLDEAPAAVRELKSQGQPDTADPGVVASREGFNELRVRLPVINQYFTYSGMHGGTADARALAKIKAIVLAWVRINQPTGKPIDETNFENLLRVIGARWGDFSGGEQAEITDWLQRLRTAKENWQFVELAGEGTLRYGNHYTHHYKILLQVYDLLGLTAQRTALLQAIGEFSAVNLPFGNADIRFPASYTITGTSQSQQRFDVAGNQVVRFPAGSTFQVNGNSQWNNARYTVASTQYLSSSDRTRIFTVEPVQRDGGGGTVWEQFDPAQHDMPRAATVAGESIDYIRRDALHYHQYNLEPWLEIAILAGGTTFATVVDQQFAFLQTQILNPPVKNYEFAATTDSFDRIRWERSQPEYLQPLSMYRPDKIARVVFSYVYYKRLTQPAFDVDERLLSFALRSDVLPSHWYPYFRWVFGGLYG